MRSNFPDYHYTHLKKKNSEKRSELEKDNEKGKKNIFRILGGNPELRYSFQIWH